MMFDEAELSPRVWLPVERSGLVWRTWGDEYVFLVAETGATHLISHAAAHLVLGLLDFPNGLSTADILTSLGGTQGFDTSNLPAFEQVLLELQQANLARSRVH